MIEMSRSLSKDIGAAIEELLCDRYGWEHRGDGSIEEPDARHPSGRPIEIKGAAVEISDGSSSRSGRFFIRERAHRELLDQGGDYALAVYELDESAEEIAEGIEILSTVIIPARFVDALIGSWTPINRAGERGSTQIPHSRIPMLQEAEL
jgi:hypothetical protein